MFRVCMAWQALLRLSMAVSHRVLAKALAADHVGCSNPGVHQQSDLGVRDIRDLVSKRPHPRRCSGGLFSLRATTVTRRWRARSG